MVEQDPAHLRGFVYRETPLHESLKCSIRVAGDRCLSVDYTKSESA